MNTVESGVTGWLRGLADLASEPVVVFAADGRVEHANAAAERTLGCRAGGSLETIAARLGEAAAIWVRRSLDKGRRAELDAAALHLAPAELQRLAWQPLGEGGGALHLRLAPQRPPAGGAADELGLRVIWEAPFPALLLDARHRIIEANRAFCEFCERPREQLIGRDPIDLLPDEDLAAARAQRLQRADPEAAQRGWFERRLRLADGSERWCRNVVTSLVGSDGRAFQLVTMQDTTAEHLARARADRSARELDDWFLLSPVGMVLYDPGGLLVRTNPAFEALVGELPVSLAEAGDSLRRLLAWDDRTVARQQAGSEPQVVECWIGVGAAPPRRLRSTVRSYRSPDGELRFMAVVEDRSADEERDIAQLKIDALMETAGIGLATFREASGWVHHQVAPGGREAGRAAEGASNEALRSISRDMVLPQTLDAYEQLQQALRRIEPAQVLYAIQHPTLGVRWLSSRVEPATLASGQRTISLVTLDVTRQQETQARSEQLLRELDALLESSRAGIAYLRGPLLSRCNRRFQAMVGLRRASLEGSSIHELFGGDNRMQRLVRASLQALAEGRRFRTEVELPPRPASGRPPRWLEVSVRRSGPNEAIVRLADIGTAKAQERERERLAREHELMFGLSEVGVAFIRQGVIERANSALQQLTGYSAAELAIAPAAVLFGDRETFERVTAQQQQALALHGRWQGEWPLRQRSGRSIWVRVSQRLAVEGDPRRGLIAAYVDVDDRHRAERLAGLQAERTRLILDSVLVGIVIVGERGIGWMNRSARRMFGGDLGDFVDLPLETVATPEPDHPFRQTRHWSALAEGLAETFECRVRARDGREFWVVGNAVATGATSSTQGRQVTYALLDVDRRRQAEARRSHAETSLQRLIEAAPLAITLRDAATLRVLHANQTAARSVGRTLHELVGSTPEDIFPADVAAQRRSDMEAALASPSVTSREYRVEGSGPVQVWDARYLPLAARPSTPPDQLLLVATNVTEQRLAQQAQLDAAIGQREMLVKEVHHRIKNNLQGVVGLMQQIAQRKPEVAGPIAEVVGQVQTIAQVYGLQVGSRGPLPVQGIVEAITQSVQRTFGRPIGLFVTDGREAEPWLLPQAESIPIALAFNELLTNAVKHSGAGAPVECRLVCNEDGAKLAIVNRGRLPEGFDLTRYPGGISGLGLVQALLPRRSATLALSQQGESVLSILLLRPPALLRGGSVHPQES